MFSNTTHDKMHTCAKCTGVLIHPPLTNNYACAELKERHEAGIFSRVKKKQNTLQRNT